MGAIAFAGLTVLLLFVLLALYARGGPTETPGSNAPARGDVAPLFSDMSLDAYLDFLVRLVAELGFEVKSSEVREQGVDIVAVDPTPITGQRVYVRGVLPSSEGMVQSGEVQAALDAARGRGFGKAIVITPSVFSNEAQLVARGVPLDLIDGAELEKLVRKHLPEFASRLVRR
jgi:hypothetical protein